MLVTEKIFQAFLKCETKSFLISSGSGSTKSEFRGWQRYTAEDFKQKCFVYLRSSLKEDGCLVSTLPTKGAEDKYRLVLDCHVLAQGMQTHIHALERTSCSDKRNYHPYIPIRFIPREK